MAECAKKGILLLWHLPELEYFYLSTCQQHPNILYNSPLLPCILDSYSYRILVIFVFCNLPLHPQQLLWHSSVLFLLHRK